LDFELIGPEGELQMGEAMKGHSLRTKVEAVGSAAASGKRPKKTGKAKAPAKASLVAAAGNAELTPQERAICEAHYARQAGRPCPPFKVTGEGKDAERDIRQDQQHFGGKPGLLQWILTQHNHQHHCCGKQRAIDDVRQASQPHVVDVPRTGQHKHAAHAEQAAGQQCEADMNQPDL
jgi:hypothetical protein